MSGAAVAGLLEIQRRSFDAAGAGVRASWPERDALTAEELERFLAGHRFGVLATARADGRAHAAPVAFSHEEGTFWAASVDGLRLRNLRASPWASLVVMEGEGESHRVLTAEGPVLLHEGAELAPALARLQPRWGLRHGGEPHWAAALIELRPERVFSHASRARG